MAHSEAKLGTQNSDLSKYKSAESQNQFSVHEINIGKNPIHSCN